MVYLEEGKIMAILSAAQLFFHIKEWPVLCEGSQWKIIKDETVVITDDFDDTRYLHKGNDLIVRNGKLYFYDKKNYEVFLHGDALLEGVEKNWKEAQLSDALKACETGSHIKAVYKGDLKTTYYSYNGFTLDPREMSNYIWYILE
jgi:hypothetical protein